MDFQENLQQKTPKRGGGEAKALWTFPEIHPFWRAQASLKEGPDNIRSIFLDSFVVSLSGENLEIPTQLHIRAVSALSV